MSNRRKTRQERVSQSYRSVEKMRPQPTRKPGGDWARTADFNLPFGPLRSRVHPQGVRADVDTRIEIIELRDGTSVVEVQAVHREHKPGRGSWLHRASRAVFEAMTVKDLRASLEYKGVPFTTRMKKADLVELAALRIGDSA